MKARQLKKRDRQTPGRATGDIECDLLFPATDERYTLRPFGKHGVENAKKFILRHLGDREAVIEGATFTLYAEVRSSTGGLRRLKLVKWQHGDDLERAFAAASERWNQLEIEDDHSSTDVEIDIR